MEHPGPPRFAAVGDEIELAPRDPDPAAAAAYGWTVVDAPAPSQATVGDEPVDGRVVVAPSAPAARERVLALSEVDVSDVEETDSLRYVISDENDAVPDFEVERVSESE
jgi:hypothetical protein